MDSSQPSSSSQKRKRSRGKRGGKKHTKATTNSEGDNHNHKRSHTHAPSTKWSGAQGKEERFASSHKGAEDKPKNGIGRTFPDKPVVLPTDVVGKAATDTPKPRDRRGKRGGGSRRKPSNLNSERLDQHVSAATTTWSALEKEWFSNAPGTEDDDNGDVRTENGRTIPDPILLSDIMTATHSKNHDGRGTFGRLQQVWQNFSQKRQRQNKANPNIATAAAALWQPRPIQLQAWSILLPPSSLSLQKDSTTQQVNMIGLSPTASGKTLAFGAPMVVAAACANASLKSTQQQQQPQPNLVFGIILVPTRELAQQVAREVESMVSCLPETATTNPPKQLIRVLTCCGGDKESTQDQIRMLQSGPPGCKWLVSATPGRCWDIVQKCNNDNGADDSNKQRQLVVKPDYIVLDESDRLAGNSDLGQQVTSILEACMSPESTSLAFFSATYPHKVQEQWKEWMKLSQRSCAMIRVDAVSLDTSNKRQKTTTSREGDDKGEDTVSGTGAEGSDELSAKSPDGGGVKEEKADDDDDDDDMGTDRAASELSNKTNDFLSSIPACLVQTLHVCAEHKKPKKLIHTLDKIRKEEKTHDSRQKRLGIIFFGRIKTLQYISKLMQQQSKHVCLELHSQLPQHERTKNLQAFQAGKVSILLATDIAARGVHIPNISFVINYDFPSSLEQYVHRCGRAGRNYQSHQDDKLPPTIYSFFTRSMAPMAPDTVALLKASEAWVDPNLVALISETGEGSNPKKKRGKQANPSKSKLNGGKPDNNPNEATDGPCLEADDSENDDAFPELSAKKIVLKRAGHVSDASTNSDESSDEE